MIQFDKLKFFDFFETALMVVIWTDMLQEIDIVNTSSTWAWHWVVHGYQSFIQTISIAPFQVHCYSEVSGQRRYCPGNSRRSATGNWVKDLPKAPTLWLERESNPWPFGRKASTPPMRHHDPHIVSQPRFIFWWGACTDFAGICELSETGSS